MHWGVRRWEWLAGARSAAPSRVAPSCPLILARLPALCCRKDGRGWRWARPRWWGISERALAAEDEAGGNVFGAASLSLQVPSGSFLGGRGKIRSVAGVTPCTTRFYKYCAFLQPVWWGEDRWWPNLFRHLLLSLSSAPAHPKLLPAPFAVPPSYGRRRGPGSVRAAAEPSHGLHSPLSTRRGRGRTPRGRVKRRGAVWSVAAPDDRWGPRPGAGRGGGVWLFRHPQPLPHRRRMNGAGGGVRMRDKGAGSGVSGAACAVGIAGPWRREGTGRGTGTGTGTGTRTRRGRAARGGCRHGPFREDPWEAAQGAGETLEAAGGGRWPRCVALPWRRAEAAAGPGPAWAWARHRGAGGLACLHPPRDWLRGRGGGGLGEAGVRRRALSRRVGLGSRRGAPLVRPQAGRGHPPSVTSVLPKCSSFLTRSVRCQRAPAPCGCGETGGWVLHRAAGAVAKGAMQ